jgi:hypothetical protein
MPNVNIHIDHGLLLKVGPAVDAALAPLRDLLCERFAVSAAACQLAVIAVRGLPDQPQVNLELSILPRPERTRDRVTAVCAEVQALMTQAAGMHVAVRCAQLDPETYVALK